MSFGFVGHDFGVSQVLLGSDGATSVAFGVVWAPAAGVACVGLAAGAVAAAGAAFAADGAAVGFCA